MNMSWKFIKLLKNVIKYSENGKTLKNENYIMIGVIEIN